MPDYLLSKRDHGICDLCGSTDYLQGNHICGVCNSSEDKEPRYKTKRKTVSSETKSNRLIAKKYGASNLTGSIKQKEWGEKIRAFILQSPELNKESKKELAGFVYAQTAKFWIENRYKDISCFEIDYILSVLREKNRLESDLFNIRTGSRFTHEIEAVEKKIEENKDKLFLN